MSMVGEGHKNHANLEKCRIPVGFCQASPEHSRKYRRQINVITALLLREGSQS
jgi:hypothetical protein